jgi:hypothetical protein
MKKVYKQPTTASIEVCPQSILCGSSGYTNPNIQSGGSGSGIIGG